MNRKGDKICSICVGIGGPGVFFWCGGPGVEPLVWVWWVPGVEPLV